MDETNKAHTEFYQWLLFVHLLSAKKLKRGEE